MKQILDFFEKLCVLYGKMLLVRMIENNRFMLILGQVSLS